MLRWERVAALIGTSENGATQLHQRALRKLKLTQKDFSNGTKGVVPAKRGVKNAPVKLSSVSSERLLALSDSVAEKLLVNLMNRDHEDLDKERSSSVATAYGIVMSNRQLLKGEPTAIVQFDDLRKMDDLISALMKEVARRGFVQRMDPTTLNVSLESVEDAEIVEVAPL